MEFNLNRIWCGRCIGPTRTKHVIRSTVLALAAECAYESAYKSRRQLRSIFRLMRV
jgi:hypothetical protein